MFTPENVQQIKIAVVLRMKEGMKFSNALDAAVAKSATFSSRDIPLLRTMVRGQLSRKKVSQRKPIQASLDMGGMGLSC